MDSTQKLITYMSTVKDYINVDAVFSDETLILETCGAKSNEEITVKIRTAKNNCDEVFLSMKIKD